MVPSRGTCTLLASHRGRGSGARGAGSCRAEGCRRGRTGCVREPTPGQMPHRPARRTRDSPALRRPMIGSPGLLSSAPAKGEPRDPRAHGNPGFSFRRGGVDLGGETPVPDTAPLSSLPQRRAGPGEPDRRTAAAAAKETFSPEQPVPAPSASSACGLPLYFSPNRLPVGHGMRGCSGIGREFRIWRRPCWSLWAWSAWLL